MTKKVRLTKEILDNAAKMALANLKLDADDMPWVDNDLVNVYEQLEFVQKCFPDSKDEVTMMDVTLKSLNLWCTPKGGFWLPILRKTLDTVVNNPEMDLTLSHYQLLLASDEIFAATAYVVFASRHIIPKDEMVDAIQEIIYKTSIKGSATEIAESLILLEDLGLLVNDDELYMVCRYETSDPAVLNQCKELHEMLFKLYGSISTEIFEFLLLPFEI